MRKLDKRTYEIGPVAKAWHENPWEGTIIHYLKLRDGKLVVVGYDSVCVYSKGRNLDDGKIGELLSEVAIQE